MNKAIRLLVITTTCYLVARALLAEASLSDVFDAIVSRPRVAGFVLALIVITAWGLVGVFRSSHKE